MLMGSHLENVCWVLLMHLNVKLRSAWLESRETPFRCPLFEKCDILFHIAEVSLEGSIN